MKNAHFIMSDCPEDLVKSVTDTLIQDFNECVINECKLHSLNTQILMNLSRLKCRFEQNGLQSESEVRYAICDPILSFLCDHFHYVIALEDSVADIIEEDLDDHEDSYWIFQLGDRTVFGDTLLQAEQSDDEELRVPPAKKMKKQSIAETLNPRPIAETMALRNKVDIL